MQLPIVVPAPLVTAHAGVFRDLFENRCQFRHFQNYLTGLMVLSNKSMANIVRCVLNSADKTNLSRFFSESPWFQSQVNDRRLRYLLQQTKAVRLPKAQSALVLDDTLCEHVGSLFEYIDRHYNHGDDTYPLAHNPVTSHYVSGPVRFPVDLRLYRRYEEMTRWEEFVAVLQRRKKDWISILKKNRNLETNSFVLKDAAGKRIPLDGPHIGVEDLVPLIPATAYRPVKVGDTTYWTFTLTVRIPDLGKVRIVISFENAELTGTYAVLVTNRVDWTAQRIIATYLQRWPIETFYQDGKGQLGLDEYRMRDAEAIQKHWCLVFVAYSLLHLDCLPPSLTKSRLPIKTIGEACRQQGQALIEALIMQMHEQLQQGQKAQDVFTQLFAKQQTMAIA